PGGDGGPGLGGVDGLLDGQGAGVGGHNQENQQIGRDVMAAVQNDARGDAGLAAALTGAGTGRARMTGVIHQAIADVEALGLSTHTPQGKRALIEAVERRLRETQNTVADGRADAATHAASADTTAAGYGGISPAGAGGLPGMGAMPGGGMPGMGGGMPGGLGSLSPASALSGLTGMASGLSALGKSDTEGWRDASDRGRQVGDLSSPGIADEKGLQKWTKVLNRAISEAFPEITDIGGVRPDSLKWHPQGLALDVMIPNSHTAGGKALGDRVVQFLLDNGKRLGLAHMIWRQRMINPDGSSSMMENRGGPTANHMDHVHVTSIGGGHGD
ncbi:hypothetical protein, partial [Mycolicibacterium fallax]|uniref:hypothetical protein n=1 Tax=Mycolicibacterium fallax TaxID=1793 RepID=UPI0013FD66B0